MLLIKFEELKSEFCFTWITATFRRTPLISMALEVARITIGPTKNLTNIEIIARVFPQVMIFGCNPMNRPV